MQNKSFVLILLALMLFFIIFLPQKIMGLEARLQDSKVTFRVSEDSCRDIIPNLTLCFLYGKVNYLADTQNTSLSPCDDNKDLGFMVLYNHRDNSIYAHDIVKEEGEIIYNGKPHHYWLKEKYYYLGKGELENGIFKPTFLKGTRISLHKPFFLNLFEPNEIRIHIPGDLKPDFITYLIELDGKRREVILTE